METPVIAIEKTSNKKTGPVSVTYKTQNTCPKSCPLYKAGCYAESGPIGIHTTRLNNSKIAYSIELEVQEINKLTGTLPLRLDIVGDTLSNSDAKKVAKATERFPIVWKYTHNWRELIRTSFAQISVLASIETDDQMAQAHNLGYAFAIIVPEHASDKAYYRNGFKLIPCPAQTRKVQCVDCKLCWKDTWLWDNKIGIAFAAHGNRKKKVTELVQIV